MKQKISRQYRLAHKILLLIGIPLIFQYVFVSVLGLLLLQSEQEVMRERHARSVIGEANGLLRSYMDLGALVYLYQSSERTAFKEQLDTIIRSIPDRLANLRLLVRESPQFKRDGATVARLGEDGLFILNQAQAIMSSPRQSKGLNSPIFGLVNRLESFLGEMKKFLKDQEHLELQEPERGALARMRVVAWLVAGLVLNTGLAVYLAIVFNKDALRRLNSLMENTRLFRANKDLQPPVSGSDEIAEMDAAFHVMAADLREVSARKRELQAMVTHDLRTPLTNIRLSLSALIEGVQGGLPARTEKVIRMAERNCSRLIRLINDLLDIEKLESGQFSLNKKQLDLLAVFAAVEDATAEFAAEKSIKIIASTPSIVIEGDGDRLVQVLVNLVSNAIKFSPRDTSVWIEASEHPDYVEMSVRDEGRGIPAEALPRIFDRFHQVAAEDGARGKGTGLGLSIARALIEAHDGKMGVESELGKGTRFFMQLPRLSVPATQSDSETAAGAGT